MLDKALKFEKAFARMYVDDQNYQKQCREIGTTTKNPSTDDWKNVKAFVKFLNIFYHLLMDFLLLYLFLDIAFDNSGHPHTFL